MRILFLFGIMQLQLLSAYVLLQARTRVASTLPLYARASKPAKEETQQLGSGDSSDDMVTVPFNGLIGAENAALFDKPLEIFDPTKDTDSLPGEDGSDEKIAAIMGRIQQRVEELKIKGSWGDEVEEFGKDPLSNQPIYTTMAMQLKACKPFESVSDLSLTFLLLVATTISLSLYIIALREGSDAFITWFINTDFEILAPILRSS
jgi:hypothetical protein